ncbi:ATP-dependent helicase, partial [bacterium]|nr:ATP-dependent helicase [bacterium]
MSRELKLILGPPGTGKTTTLINKVKEHLDGGTHPSKIAFVSFTKKAATEAADRARSVLNLPRKDLINFRTLHSLAFQSLGIRRGEVMGRNDYLEIASLLGVEFRGYADMSDGVYCATEGDMMLHMVGLAHAKVQELRDVWEYINPDFDWFKLKQFNDTIEQYKQDTAKIDFNDMIKQYTSQRLLCEVDIAIIDEAQDLSNAQWDMVKVAFRGAKHIYLAGDDDQAIYEWSGANIERFLGLSTDREVLPLTYRLPKQIMEVTESIAARIKNRFEKSYRSMNATPGVVHRVNDVYSVKITSGSWFLLARNAMHLSDYKQLCREQGVGFTDKRGTSVDMDHLKAIKAWVQLRQGNEITEAMHSLIHMLAQNKKV